MAVVAVQSRRMKLLKIVAVVALVALVAVLGAVLFNQWRLERAWQQLAATTAPDRAAADAELLARLRQAEARYEEAITQLKLAEQKLAVAQTLASQRLPTRRTGGEVVTDRWTGVVPAEAVVLTESTLIPAPGAKRSWGPEQVIGEPDTLTAGDIPTAWAPLEQNGGEEWLKLDYAQAVDITEVRVRETYNPGAVAKVTAVLPGGREVTLWEGVEPRHEAPVEMGFSVTAAVRAATVKVYLDTRRVPGWNEIDAVQLLGRDGSQQWATNATASSTYADRMLGSARLLERLGR